MSHRQVAGNRWQSRLSKQCEDPGGSRDMASKFWMKMIFNVAKLISVMVDFSNKQGLKIYTFHVLTRNFWKMCTLKHEEENRANS